MSFERFGQSLCSRRNPRREAEAWLSEQPKIQSDEHVVILGVGAGYHVDLWQKQNPSSRLILVDVETRWLERFSGEKHLLNEVSRENFEPLTHLMVLVFRPAWVGFEKEFTDLFFDLTQRSEGVLLQELSSDPHRQKIWRVLEELIQ